MGGDGAGKGRKENRGEGEDQTIFLSPVIKNNELIVYYLISYHS